MIVRRSSNAFQLFFILRGSIIPLIYPQIIFIALLGAGIVAIHDYYPALFPSFTLAPLALLGVALSLFLGFRNNASYDRWWEARKLWGQLIVDSRSLSRQILSYIDGSTKIGADTQKRMTYLIIAFSHSLRHQLRESDPWPEIEKYLTPNDIESLRQSKNKTDMLLRLIGHELGNCRRNALLPDLLIQNFDERITSMASIQAGCERIKNTPLPFAYMLLVHRTAYLYCFILPFGIVASMGILTPFFCAVVAYTFFGLDALSEELEEPFGLLGNDLALTSMSRTIEIDLLSSLGETELPDPIKVVNHCIE